VLPFCSSWAFSETGVLELKNFSQFAVIAATAAALPAAGLPEAAELAGVAGAEEEAGALEDDVAAVLLELLLQAAAVRASATDSAAAGANRRAKGLNRTTRLLKPRSDVLPKRCMLNGTHVLASLHRMLPRVRPVTHR
jgi:hypothetical protein